MKLPFNFLLVCLLVFVMSACSSDGPTKMTPNGYKYIAHIENEGEKPTYGNLVFYRSTIRSKDTVFYKTTKSNLIERARLPRLEDLGASKMNHVLEALMLMSKGDSVTLFCPIDSLKLKAIPPIYQGVDELIYDLKMVDFKNSDEQVREQAKRMDPARVELTAFYESFKRGEPNVELTTTESGIQYNISKTGSNVKAKEGQKVYLDYLAFDMEGRAFDNSFQREVPFFVRYGDPRLLKGWNEAISLLNKDGEGIFVIPSELAYGAKGNPTLGVAENMDIMVYFKLLAIRD